MDSYIETGIGRGTSGKALDMGRTAAIGAIKSLSRYRPTLALLFVSSELDIQEVTNGVSEVLGDCPLMGTSTAGEIANGYFARSVVVVVMASPSLHVRIGVGSNVSLDYRRAVFEALAHGDVAEYFSGEHPLHQMLHLSMSRSPGVSPVFMIMFSPGATMTQPSLSHEIHTELRKASTNRVPIFGGSSSDFFHFEANCQIANGKVCQDALVVAFVEADILFGLGVAHGFSPTAKAALVTRASGHVVHELDGRPAVEVCSELLGIPIGQLGNRALWFSRFPFGTTDLYGNSLLQVPECVLPDGSIQFGPLMRTNQVITLMRAGADDIVEAGLSAYNKAVRQGGLKRPALAVMFSCALRKRLMGKDETREMDLLRRRTRIPVGGFYTFGEQGISDDGMPVFLNQSVSMLVLSDELNPLTALMHKGKRVYYEFTSRLSQKETQMKVLSRISQMIQEGGDSASLIRRLSNKLNVLFPWADWRVYLPSETPSIFVRGPGCGNSHFPASVSIREIGTDCSAIPLDSQGKRLGLLVFRRKKGMLPDEEDTGFAKTVGRLIARGLQRIEVDRRLAEKLVHLEILNEMAREVSKTISTRTKLQNIVKHIRRILKVPSASLWLLDPAYHFLLKEVSDHDKVTRSTEPCIDADEQLAKWQVSNDRPVSSFDAGKDGLSREFSPPHGGFISLPISYKNQMRGVLNLFWQTDKKFSQSYENTRERLTLMTGIANQLAIFVENEYLRKNATFLKEIHHRVKNNLQNVASILRLQIRRLDRTTAEQAMNDSIARIMSIALVHDTLCKGEIGMVDLRDLIDSVSGVSLKSHTDPLIELFISGPTVVLPSREATSLALVLNELVQNAARHAYRGQSRGKLYIEIDRQAKNLSVTVRDEGSGLPDGFDPDRDGNLGLTIVRTLVKDDLHGRFQLSRDKETTARVTFPLPKNYYDLRS